MTENKSKSSSPKAELAKTSADPEVGSEIGTEEDTEEEMIVTTDSEVEMTEDHEEISVGIGLKVVSIVARMVISPGTAVNVSIFSNFSARKPR